MKMKRPGVFAPIAVAAALTLTSCGSDSEKATDMATEQATAGTIVDVVTVEGSTIKI